MPAHVARWCVVRGDRTMRRSCASWTSLKSCAVLSTNAVSLWLSWPAVVLSDSVNRSVLAPAPLLDSCGSELERRSGRLSWALPDDERDGADAASSPEADRAGDDLSATAAPTTARLKGCSSGRNVWAEGDRARVSQPTRSQQLAVAATAAETRAVQAGIKGTRWPLLGAHTPVLRRTTARGRPRLDAWTR